MHGAEGSRNAAPRLAPHRAARIDIVKNQIPTLAIGIVFMAMVLPAQAADPAPEAPLTGFYGGVSLRSAGTEGAGLSFGHLQSAWTRFALPTTDDGGARTLVYGGFRWANDLALEASFATLDRISLAPSATGTRRGVGLALTGDGDAVAKTWNVDVYTSWEFRKSLALYGRLGYAQSDAAPAYVPAFTSDTRRGPDGLNYGLGVRYDMSSAFGLRLEYARFGRLPGDAVAGLLPDNDQVQVGLQFRF